MHALHSFLETQKHVSDDSVGVAAQPIVAAAAAVVSVVETNASSEADAAKERERLDRIVRRLSSRWLRLLCRLPCWTWIRSARSKRELRLALKEKNDAQVSAATVFAEKLSKSWPIMSSPQKMNRWMN